MATQTITVPSSISSDGDITTATAGTVTGTVQILYDDASKPDEVAASLKRAFDWYVENVQAVV